ncbi:hypothetical protein ACEQ8H_009002, partial [Pleosporales sp. CAS-2024a]
MPLPSMRLRFAKFLAHNVTEAKIYNVQDAATRLEYVQEFVLSSPQERLRQHLPQHSQVAQHQAVARSGLRRGSSTFAAHQFETRKAAR